MIMIRQRMQTRIENSVCATQCGFRPQRSTSHAWYIIRRIQDYAEVKGARLSLALLDWGKTVDKVQHDKLTFTLKMISFNQHILMFFKVATRNPLFM